MGNARRTLASGTGLVLGLASVVALGGTTLVATPALAAGTATYSCPAPVVGPQDSTTTYDTDLPETVWAGSGETVTVNVSSSGVAKDSATGQAWSLLGARKMSSSSQMPLTIGGTTRTASMTGPVVPINHGGDTTLVSSGTWGEWTVPATPQKLDVTMAESYVATISLLKDNGSHTSMSPQNPTCTVKAGQNRVIDTVRVMARSQVAATVANASIQEDVDAFELSADVTVSAGTVAGKVLFTVGPKKVTGTVVGGKATAVVTGLPAGSYPYTATFQPDLDVYEAATSAEQLLTVTPAVPATPTVTSMTLDQTQVTTAQSARAQVSVDAGGVAPAGQARVVVNGKPTTVALVNGKASVDLPLLRAGSYPVTAGFLPADAKAYAPSTSSPVTLTVVPGAGGDAVGTSTFLTLSTERVLLGSSLSARATVYAQGDAPRGRVNFGLDGRTISAQVVNGVAVVSLPFMSSGTYPVTAEFVPDSGAGFLGSEADAKTFVVAPPKVSPPVDPVDPGTPGGGGSGSEARVSVLALSSPQQVALGQQAMVSAVVDVQGAAASGTVAFRMGSELVRVPVVGGVASGRVPARAVGSHVLTAAFEPTDPSAQAASLGSRTVLVTKAGSSTTVRTAAGKGRVRATVQVTTAGATCGAPVKVTVRKGTYKRTATVRSSCAGTATASVKVPTRGTYRVRVAFRGGATASASTAVGKVKVVR